jgi:hypothetical protein
VPVKIYIIFFKDYIYICLDGEHDIKDAKQDAKQEDRHDAENKESVERKEDDENVAGLHIKILLLGPRSDYPRRGL